MAMSKASETYFKKVAGQWDDLRSDYFTEDVRKAAISKAYLRPEMVVADVGAGTGFMTAGLVSLVSRVYVMDGSASMLEVARKNLSSFNSIEYHQSNGHLLPLNDAVVDVVFANMYLHHCPDPRGAIKEMVRIIKPGGRLVITDLDSHNFTWMKEEMADEWLGFERDQIRTWFKEEDLVNILVDCTGQSCCATSDNETLASTEQGKAEISVFLATGSKRIAMQSTVKETYGNLAQSGSSCGCDSSGATTNCGCSDSASQSTGNFSQYYDAADMGTVPQNAADFSLGCGNPIAMADLKEGEIVLDIGSGGGLDSFLAARKVGLSGKVIGVDLTPAMIERAREAAVKAGIANVEFRPGRAETLPVEDNMVDVILSNCVINLCEDKAVVFNEAYRVLREGGRLEISDIVTDSALPAAARQEGENWAACVTGSLPEKEYVDLISQAGFQNIKLDRSNPYGTEHGVSVYSLRVSAQKILAQAAAACSPD